MNGKVGTFLGHYSQNTANIDRIPFSAWVFLGLIFVYRYSILVSLAIHEIFPQMEWWANGSLLNGIPIDFNFGIIRLALSADVFI